MMNPTKAGSIVADSAARFAKSDAMRTRAHALIPGGCDSMNKGDDQYPILSPGFIVRGLCCHVWDVDGNRYVEYGMGLRAVTLGHAYLPVIEAAQRQLWLGANFTRPAAIEVECAEAFLDLIDGAEMVKFTKNGSSATTAAVKLAGHTPDGISWPFVPIIRTSHTMTGSSRRPR
jgi:glutamate-1-semialdehyde 2,1-aminomutase